jgi:hypothetical protein
MTNSKVPMITDLSEENRKLALKQTEELLHMLGQCECYLRDYAAGTQNVAKLFGVMCYTEEALVSARDELAKINPTILPQKLRRSDEEPWGHKDSAQP